MAQIDSVCTYCGVGCEVTAEVEDNKIVRFFAKKEHEVSRGKLCVKGTHGWDFVHSENRLPEVKIRKTFIDENRTLFPKNILEHLLQAPHNDTWIYPSLEISYDITAIKLKSLIDMYGSDTYCGIGGARTSCESSYLFQKFTRDVVGSPNIDNCARVCHAPSLKGMRAIIGEGAATNPFADIINTENMIVIGSNTTEAHPIVAYKMMDAVKKGATLSAIDVRITDIFKSAEHKLVLPYESNLMMLNMMAYVILSEHLYKKEFIDERTKYFEEYKASILSDTYANPDFFQSIKGYESLSEQIRMVARTYAQKKSMIFWGLGITEHTDGSVAVMAICNLAILTGNIGKSGAGLMPLRGQNNVQGTCDMGCLPYYLPDYQKPQVEGMKTPSMIDAMNAGKVKALFNIGEDIAHIHANQSKIESALSKLELFVVNELFDCEVTKYADVVYGVKSAYEKTGVYVNAERRLHLSQPIVHNDLPDDWEVIEAIGKRLDNRFVYEEGEDVWEEVRQVAHRRYSGASYELLKKHRLSGVQWPVKKVETPILHLKDFRTEDGIGVFRYTKYQLRGQLREILEGSDDHGFYLTTGRKLAHYNNANQTKESPKLIKKMNQDILYVSYEDEAYFKDKPFVSLSSHYGKSASLKVKMSKSLKSGTMYTTFHFASSKINYLFGDASDEFTKTARFKSQKVYVEVT